MSYFLAFLAFAALIVLHEAGHFAAAKAVGMRVEKFSLFFGPMIFKRQIGETVYGVGTIPLGGYVKITGMSEVEILETPSLEARAYYNQPVWKRIVVIGAGPAVNLVLAFILAWFFFLGQNHYVTNSAGDAQIRAVVAGSVLKGGAAAGKLQARDQFVSIDGSRNILGDGIQAIVSDRCASGEKTNGCEGARVLTIVVRRDGKLLTFHLRPRYDSKLGRMLIGFVPAVSYKTASTGPIYAAGQSISGLWRVTRVTVSDIAQLFKAKDRSKLTGIVTGYHVTQEAINQSFSKTLEIIALISLSLGVINLFPFLPLDGGHIFWSLVEKVRGKRVPVVVMERASMVGIVLILILFVIGLTNSVHMLSSGH